MTGFTIGLFYPTSTSIHSLSRLPKELNPDVLDARSHVRLIREAEAAGLDYAFLADTWGSRGPVSAEHGLSDPMLFCPTLAGVLIGATERIKIITTMHQAWLHPLHIARIGANLDALSGGRWGMNAVSGAGFNPELLGSVTSLRTHDELYDSATESMEIILQAWTGDGEVDFEGKYYTAKGRLVGPSPVQDPHPMIVSAGASPAGCEFAGRFASTVFIPGRATPELIADRRAQIRAVAKRRGRADHEVKVLLHASVIVGDTQGEADTLSEQLRESVDMAAVHEYLAGVSQISTYEEMLKDYTAEQLLDVGHTAGTIKIHGSPAHVADTIQDLHERTGCDGLSLSFPIWRPEQIRRFGERVGPLLERCGLWTRRHAQG